jgi:hypothetical protein
MVSSETFEAVTGFTVAGDGPIFGTCVSFSLLGAGSTNRYWLWNTVLFWGVLPLSFATHVNLFLCTSRATRKVLVNK